MKDVLMDMFKLGVGAADLTREQAEALVARLQERYKDEITDGRAMVDDLLKQAEENSQKFRARVKSEVDKAIQEQKLVDEQDLKELAANVEELARTTQKVAVQAAKNAAKAAKQAAKEAMKQAKAAAKKPAKPKRAKKPAKKVKNAAKKAAKKKAKKPAKKAGRAKKRR